MIDYSKADPFFQCIIHELLYNASMACLFKLNIHKIILYLLFINFLDKTLRYMSAKHFTAEISCC